MVLCIVALVIFGILGIFSAKYREYAKEAFRCVTRTVTLRPCDTGFDAKLKAKIVSKLSKVNVNFGRAAFKHYHLLSWFFFILFFSSFIYSAISVYNYVAYGNCNGKESNAFCIFNAFGKPSDLKKPLNLEGIKSGDTASKAILIEFGCFTCRYTKEAEQDLRQFLAERKDIYFIFKPFPIPTHPYSFEAAQAAFCAEEQGRFEAYKDLLFENQETVKILGMKYLKKLAKMASLNETAFSGCIDTNRTASKVQKIVEEGKIIGIYGTPTFFLNGKPAVGPLDYNNFKKFAEGKNFEIKRVFDDSCKP